MTIRARDTDTLFGAIGTDYGYVGLKQTSAFPFQGMVVFNVPTPKAAAEMVDLQRSLNGFPHFRNTSEIDNNLLPHPSCLRLLLPWSAAPGHVVLQTTALCGSS